MLLNQDNQVFAARRIDTTSEAWQMPQGGIDGGEQPVDALFREMREETGTDKAEILAEHPEWLYYDLPADLKPKLWKGRYNGQRQRWFKLRFTGVDTDINIHTEEPEFLEWRWESPAKIIEMAVPFKKAIYERLFKELY